MRVAFLTTSFPRYIGDYAGIFVYELAKALRVKGIDIHVLAPHAAGTKQRETFAGVQVTRFKYFWPPKYQRLAYGAGMPTNLRSSWMARFQVAPFTFAFLANSWKVLTACDIIHAHWIEPGLIGLLGRKVFGRPLVVSVHRFNPPGVIGRHIYRTVLRNADHVLFNSSFSFRRCMETMSVRAGEVVPEGVDTDRFYSKWQEAGSNGYASAERGPMVLAVGSLVPVKGFINLVEAMPAILNAYSCRFVIAGQGPEHERIVRRASELGVIESLTMLGQVPTMDIPGLMRQANVFALPSAPDVSGDDEALGVVLLEALASGTPCVASRTGGVVDIVEDRVNGYLVTPGNPSELASAITRLLKNGDLGKRMGQEGRRKVEMSFSWESVVKRVAAVYEQLH